MRKIEIIYDPYAARELHSGNVPKELEMIISLAHCVQNMCIGSGKNWDNACPKYLRGMLNKNDTIKAFYRATRLLAIVSLSPMYLATVTLRFFTGPRVEDSFHEVTVNLCRSGKAMTGEIRTTQQLYAFIMQ